MEKTGLCGKSTLVRHLVRSLDPMRSKRFISAKHDETPGFLLL